MLTVFRDALMKHWAVLLLGVFVGLMSVGPNVIFSLQPGYQGIPMLGIPDEIYYLARINAASIGCYWNCNPFMPEARPPAFSDASLSEPILAVPEIIFPIDAGQLDVFYEFFFPLVLTILFYSVLYRLTKDRLISIFGSCVIMCGFDFFGVSFIDLADPLRLFFGKNNVDFYITSSFLTYSRPVNPQLSSVLFLLYCHVLLSYYQTKRRIWLVLMTILSAFSWYIYLYLSTFVTMVNGCVVAVSLLRRNMREAAVNLFALIASIMLALPSILNLFASMHSGPTASSIYISHTHAPAYNVPGVLIVISFAALVAAYALRHAKTAEFYFIVTLAAASVLIVEQHVVTGIENETFHYEWYYNTPIAVFAVCFFVAIFLQNTFRRTTGIVVALALCWLFLDVGSDQYVSYIHWYPYTMSLQKYVPALEKISDGPRGALYMSESSDMLQLVPIYTHDYSPLSPGAAIYHQI